MTTGHWLNKEASVKRFLIFATMFVFVFGVLAGLACCDDWNTARANTVLKFAEAQELLETPDKPADGKCPDCYGTGKRGDGRTVFKCPTCNGTGKLKSGAEPPVTTTPPPVSKSASDSTIDPDLYGIRFTADWCGYCKIFDEKHLDKCDLKFQVVDVTNSSEAAVAAGVKGLPAFIFCDRDLQTVLARTEGNHTAESINAIIQTARQTKKDLKLINEASAPKSTVRITGENPRAKWFGSGTIIRMNTAERTVLILTCAHVIDDAANTVMVEAIQQTQNRLPGVVVRKNKDVDLAAILVQNDGSITVSNSDQIGTCSKRGRRAIAHGYPEGGTFYTLTTELIGLSSEDKIEGQDFVMFATDPSAGMSGGGLFVDGTLVGVVSMADRKRKVGFAVRSQEIREFLKGL
jgi:S1-C subfamily serine protease